MAKKIAEREAIARVSAGECYEVVKDWMPRPQDPSGETENIDIDVVFTNGDYYTAKSSWGNSGTEAGCDHARQMRREVEQEFENYEPN